MHHSGSQLFGSDMQIGKVLSFVMFRFFFPVGIQPHGNKGTSQQKEGQNWFPCKCRQSV